MFKRVIYENWGLIIAMGSFALTVTVYGVMVIRAMLMKPESRDHMAALPLDDGQPQPPPPQP
jgi:hypothetical protein